eukprot:5146610-Pyramimonas_sp.AAC.1
MSGGCVYFVADNSGVADGWYARRHAAPVGEDAGLWRKIGLAMAGRSQADFVAVFVNSHRSPQQMSQGELHRGSWWSVARQSTSWQEVQHA